MSGALERLGNAKELADAKEAREQAERQVAADLDAMTRLQRLGTLFVRHGKMRPILVESVKAAIAICRADWGEIQLVTTSGKLAIAAQWGFRPWWIRFWDEEGKHHSACGQALKSGKRIIVEDVERSPIFAGTAGLEILRRAEVRAMQSTPLVSRTGKRLGVFSTHYKAPHRPDERTLRLFDLLVRQAADIIERQQREDALRASHDRIKKILEIETVGVMYWDLASGRLIDANETFLNLTGYSRAEVEAGEMTWQTLTPPEFLDESLARFRRFQTTGHYGPYEQEYFCKDGTRRWFLLAGTSLGGNLGVNFCVDVSSHKRAEESLRRRSEEMAVILDTMPAPVFIAHDPDCFHISGNHAADALLLNPRGAEASLTASVGSRPLHFRVFKDGRELSGEELPIQQAARGISIRSFECNVTFDDEPSRELLIHAEPLWDQAGRPRGAVGVFVDLTERNQSAAALRRSEERYRTLFATLLEGFCIIEVIFDAHDRAIDYRLLEVNPAFEKQTGLSDAKGKLISELAPDNEAYWCEIYGRIALTGKPARFEKRAGALNRWFEVSAFRFGDAASRKVAILFEDITERKRLEKEIIEISEYEQRNFGHDLHDGLGQRLTGLEMLSHALAADLKRNNVAAAKEAIRLNRELRNTVTEARLISRRLAPVPMEGEGLMQGLKTLASTTRKISKVACRFTCDPPVHIQDVMTATHLYRIAQEAVNNALKHGRARSIYITLAEGSEGVRLAIENNGRVFPKLDPSQNGMGLRVMRYRAEVIGATLSIESGERKGVTVSCTIRRET